MLGEGEAVPEQARSVLEELNLAATEGEPNSFAEAEQSHVWRTMMKEEIEAIQDNGIWELTDLPRDHCTIGLKWVYKLKKGETGVVVKHKARVVTKGYVQQAGIDFDEVFVPVARMESVCLVLAPATYEGWEVHHMDVKIGELAEEVYVRQPPGFVIDGEEHKVLRL